jgi:AcrR family transcriptional regulator
VTSTGLRERKKQKTKAAIQRAAIRLFKKRGYEETTIEQIAAAAEISPSTFFNYFPSKEDVVIYDEYDPQLFAALMESSHGESMSTTLRRLMEKFGDDLHADREVILERAKLGLEVPELRARFWEEMEKARDVFAAFIASRTGRGADDFEVRVISMALIGAAFESSLEWVRRGGEGRLLDLFNRAMETAGIYGLLDRLEATATKGPPAVL